MGYRGYVSWVLAAILIVTMPMNHGHGQEDHAQSELDRVEREIVDKKKQHTRLTSEVRRLDKETRQSRQDLLSAAKEIKAAEEELLQLNEEITLAAAEEKEKTHTLLTDRKKMSDLLVTLQRLSRVPPEALLVREGRPADLMRSSLLLRAAIPELRQRATDLAQALETLASLRDGLAQQLALSNEARRELQKKYAGLEILLKQRQEEQRLTKEQQVALNKAMQNLQEKATTLRELLARVEAQKIEAFLPPAKPEVLSGRSENTPVSGPLVLNRRAFRYPVTGPITVNFGNADKTGSKSLGVHIKPLPGAVVTAPLDGMIRFAGNFKSYGRILIIQHADAYHSLVAGLRDIAVTVGQRVAAGEPMGNMSETLSESDTLYYELRQDGQPVNPKTFATYRGG